jgi:hypothetical protein
MTAICIILNLPWTILALIMSVFSLPIRTKFDRVNLALVIDVKSMWWNWRSNANAAAMGNVVLTGPNSDALDLNHELVHVRQYMDEPFIHPFLYYWEHFRRGYRDNKYEIEAYQSSRDVYRQKSEEFEKDE